MEMLRWVDDLGSWVMTVVTWCPVILGWPVIIALGYLILLSMCSNHCQGLRDRKAEPGEGVCRVHHVPHGVSIYKGILTHILTGQVPGVPLGLICNCMNFTSWTNSFDLQRGRRIYSPVNVREDSQHGFVVWTSLGTLPSDTIHTYCWHTTIQ